MKIGISSYSFSSLVETEKMNLVDVIHKAKEMGFAAIEFTNFSAPSGETRQSYAARLKQECEDIGIDICNYAVGGEFLSNSAVGWKAEADRLKEEVEIAKILGSPMMRHDATWGYKKDYRGKRRFDDALPILAKGCRAVTEYAAEMGIKTMVENHGFFCQDSERVEKLVNAVDHENFGVLVDMGNFLCADENPVVAVGRLLPYVLHVHAKDFHVKSGMCPNPGKGWFQSRGGNYLRGSIIGHGEVPILQCLNIIKNQGYAGTVSIEFEGLEDPNKGVGIGLENLRKYLNML